MKSRLISTDLAVLGIVAAVLVLGLIDRAVWFDQIMGAALVVGGLYFFFPATDTGASLRRQPTIIPYPILGTLMIIQGIALGIFHVRF